MDRVWKTYLYGFLKDSYTGFSMFSILGPKIQILDFSKINGNGIKKRSYWRNGQYFTNLYTTNTHTKFQSNIFIIRYALLQKTGTGSDVNF